MVLVVGYNSLQPPERVKTLLGAGPYLHLTTNPAISGCTKFIAKDYPQHRDEKGNIKSFLKSNEINWTVLKHYSIGEI